MYTEQEGLSHVGKTNANEVVGLISRESAGAIFQKTILSLPPEATYNGAWLVLQGKSLSGEETCQVILHYEDGGVDYVENRKYGPRPAVILVDLAELASRPEKQTKLRDITAVSRVRTQGVGFN